MPDFLKVTDVIAYLTTQESMMAAEFGCGTAFFALSLAKKLQKGRVYAIDIQEERLSALQGTLQHARISNVSTILGDLEAPGGSTLSDRSLDIVLIPNVLFQSENRRAILKEAERTLKPGGQLLVIDWLKDAPHGPKENVVLPEEVKDMAGELGLALKHEFTSGDYHYAILFTKPSG